MHICLQMYRFVVHGCITCKNQNIPWSLVSFVFGHRDFKACKEWETQIMASLEMQVGRPKNLLVYILLCVRICFIFYHIVSSFGGFIAYIV